MLTIVGSVVLSNCALFLTRALVALLYFARVATAHNDCMAHVTSMVAVLQVIYLLQAIRFAPGLVTPDMLRAAISGHLELFIAAYGKSKIRPTHHYALHLPDMLLRFLTLVGCLVHERKHRVVKRYTRIMQNLQKWDLGSLEEVTWIRAAEPVVFTIDNLDIIETFQYEWKSWAWQQRHLGKN